MCGLEEKGSSAVSGPAGGSDCGVPAWPLSSELCLMRPLTTMSHDGAAFRAAMQEAMWSGAQASSSSAVEAEYDYWWRPWKGASAGSCRKTNPEINGQSLSTVRDLRRLTKNGNKSIIWCLNAHWSFGAAQRLREGVHAAGVPCTACTRREAVSEVGDAEQRHLAASASTTCCHHHCVVLHAAASVHA